MLVALERVHPGNINTAKVKGFFTAVHPFGQRLARTTGRLNTDGIKSGRNKVVL